MNHKQATALVRTLIKDAGIKARVSKYTSCGSMWIRVDNWKYGMYFTDGECQSIYGILTNLGLTGPARLPIELVPPVGGHYVWHG